jgi:hypothetical protein
MIGQYIIIMVADKRWFPNGIYEAEILQYLLNEDKPVDPDIEAQRRPKPAQMP